MVSPTKMKLEIVPTVIDAKAYDDVLDQVSRLMYEYFCQLLSSNSSTLSKETILSETQQCLSGKVSIEKPSSQTQS